MYKKLKIYTDGACSQKASSKGKGGYGAIILSENGDEQIISGWEAETTNNRMEMMAAIMALESLQEPFDIELYSDSAYLVECFLQKWFEKWFKNGWINSSGKPVANKDLWIRLMKSFGVHKIKFVKVKGHADDEYNNRCDEIARKAKESQDQKENSGSE